MSAQHNDTYSLTGLLNMVFNIFSQKYPEKRLAALMPLLYTMWMTTFMPLSTSVGSGSSEENSVFVYNGGTNNSITL